MKKVTLVAVLGLAGFGFAETTIVTPEVKWSYTDATTPGVFANSFLNEVDQANDKIAVVYEVGNCATATISGAVTQNYGGMVKTGSGTLILGGANMLAQGYNSSAKFSCYDAQLTFDEGGNAVTNGFGVFTLAEGKVVFTGNGTKVTSKVKQTSDMFLIGARTVATDGSQGYEGDVEMVVQENAYVQTSTAGHLGRYRGFVNNTAADHPAVSKLLVTTGATFEQAGGKSFFIGEGARPSTSNRYHSDLRVEVDGGTFTHGTSFAGLSINQRNGQSTQIDIKNGGVFQEYLFQTATSTEDAGAVAPLTVNVTGAGSALRTQEFRNDTSKKAGPATVLNVTDGARFYCDKMTNYENGQIDIYLDDATVRPFGIENTHVVTDQKVVFPANVTSLTLGPNGATLQSYGQSTNPASANVKLYNTAIFAKAFTGEGGLVLSGNNAANTIRFTGANDYTGPTVLSNGVFTLDGDGIVPSVSAFTQKGGVLYAKTKDIVLGDATFASGATIRLAPGRKIVVNGTLSLASGINVIFEDENGDELPGPFEEASFFQTAVSNARELRKLATALYTTDKIAVSGFDVTVENDMATFVFSTGASSSEATWTGEGGEDTSFLTAANWDVEQAPSFLGGLTATFGTGGERATFSNVKTLAGLVFNRVGGFRISADDDDLLFLTGGTLTVEDAERAGVESYVVDAPVLAPTPVTATVPLNACLEFAKNTEFAQGIDVSGAGRVAFRGGTNVMGNVKLHCATNNLLAGTIRNVDGVIDGPLNDKQASNVHVLNLTGAVAENTKNVNVISNAVVEKSVLVTGGVMKGVGFQMAVGTTNLFKGGVYYTSPWKRLDAQADSQTVFEGGLTASWTLKLSGSGDFIIRNKPLSAYPNFSLTDSVKLTFAVTGNAVSDLYRHEGSNRTTFLVDHAFDNVVVRADNTDSVFDLADTVQEFKTFLCEGAKPTITGVEGSRLVFQKLPEKALGATNVCCKVTGAVELENGSTGELLLKGTGYTSTGAIIATSGTTIFGDTFVTSRKTTTVRFNGGVVSLADGKTYKVLKAYIGDTEVPPGKYRANDGSVLGNELTGGGTLSVCGTGMMLFIR